MNRAGLSQSAPLRTTRQMARRKVNTRGGNLPIDAGDSIIRSERDRGPVRCIRSTLERKHVMNHSISNLTTRTSSRPGWFCGAVACLLLLLALVIGGAGCGTCPVTAAAAAPRAAQPTGVAVVVVDPTDSARQGREQFLKALPSYLADIGAGWQVFLVHACSRPHLVGVERHRGQSLTDAYTASLAAARQPCPCRHAPARPPYYGSDPCQALEIADSIIGRDSFRNARKVVIGWSDLIEDGCRHGEDALYRPPATYRWRTRGVEVTFFGVPIEAKTDRNHYSRVQNAWRNQLISLSLHYPDEPIRLEEIHIPRHSSLPPF